MDQFVRLIKEEEGQALTEYGLLVGLIAIAVVTILGTVGTKLTGVFTTITEKLP
ncbi:Flp family type IVb pilin [Siminovitchia acidinfaciens]|uniref:Flp family type IVb pilin n=2 Tax=Siminovitchia acidinfaciens TaxID=2321395 RepID=A0A429XSY5_9BACI|nr:Flp family type IVb pilin [Siminovitchia acidinfaciens]